MPGMSSRTWLTALALLLPACADSCSCAGTGSGSATVTTSSTTTAPAPQVPVDGGLVENLLPEVAAMRHSFSPMPDSEAKRALERAAQAIDVTSDLGEPVDGSTLAKALPDDVEGYDASGKPQVSSAPAELGAAPFAALMYRDGKAVMNLKLTDTAKAPALRRDLAAALTTVGNAPTGNQTGALRDDVPGMHAYLEKANVSRAAALVAGRFLVEVLVDNAADKDDAWTAIGEVERDSLIKAAAAARSKQQPATGGALGKKK